MQKLIFRHQLAASLTSQKTASMLLQWEVQKLDSMPGGSRATCFCLGLRDFLFASSYCKRIIDLCCRETNETNPNVGLGKHMKHDFCWVKMCFDLSSVNNISSNSGTSPSIVLCGEPSAVPFPSWTRSCFQRYKRRSCASLHQTSGSKWALKKEKSEVWNGFGRFWNMIFLIQWMILWIHVDIP